MEVIQLDSILDSIKKLLGIQPEYNSFDEDIIVAINTSFATLNQLGVGPEGGYMIEDNTQTWNDYITTTNLNMVKTYIYLKSRLLFDPPTGGVLDAIKNQLAELEFRLYVEVDPKVNDETFEEGDEFAD